MEFFIEYANKSLVQNPQNFYPIINQINKTFPIPNGTNQSIDLIVKFSAFNNFKEADEYRKKIKSKLNPITLESSFNYVYGYEGGACYGFCPQGKNDRPKSLVNENFNGPNRLKCFECDQRYLIHVLESIIDKKEYSQIIDFHNFIAQRKNLIKTTASIVKEKTSDKIIKRDFWEPLITDYMFFALIGGITAYSLTEFLINDNRRKLKNCPACHNFFIAERLNQIYCSKGCKRAKNWPTEKWNKYMQDRRENERAERQQIQKIEREKEIEKRMREQGLTRGEAIEQIDFDDNL